MTQATARTAHAPILAPIQAPVRTIVHRTHGHSHGPITRLMSPSDLGEVLKPCG